MGLIGGGTYGPMGGQAAAAEVIGQSVGWDDYQNKRNDIIKHKQQQEAYALQRDLTVNKLKESNMRLLSQEKLARESGAFSQANTEYLTNKVSKYENEVASFNKDWLGSMLGRFLGSKTPDQELPGMQSGLASKPAMAQQLGMTANDDLRPAEINSRYDRQKMIDILSKQDPAFSKASPKVQKSMVDHAFNTKNYFFAGKHLVDAKGLAIATGTWDAQDAATKRTYDQRQLGKGLAFAASENKEPEVDLSKWRASKDSATSTSEPLNSTKNFKDVGNFKGETIAKRYQTLSPQAQSFYSDFADYAKSKGVSVALASAGRTQKEQDELYAQGRTKPGPKVTWTRNSKHLDGNASDIISSKGYSDKDGNETVAKLMREFAAQNPQYGAEFLSKSKDPNHVQFNGKGRNASQNRGTPSRAEDPATNSSDTLFRPGASGGGIDARTQVLNQLAGWSNLNQDTRTSLMKNMDYLGEQLGPDATVGDVLGALDTVKSSGKNEKQFDWQVQIEYYDKELNDRVNLPEGDPSKLTPQEAQILSNENEQEVLRSKRLGTGYSADKQRAAGQSANTRLWNKLKTNPGGVSSGMLSDMQERENMIDRPLEPKVREQLEGNVEVAEQANKIIKQIDDVGAENYFRGGTEAAQQWLGTSGDLASKAGEVYNNIANWIKDKTGTGNQISKADLMKKINNTIGLNSELGMLAASYLKSTSGTAVNEGEFMRLIGDVLGGLKSQDANVTKTALRKFADINAMQARQKMESVGSRGYGYTALSNAKRLARAYSRYKMKMPDSAKQAAIADTYSKPQKESHTTTATSQIPVDLSSMPAKVQEWTSANAIEGKEFKYKGQIYRYDGNQWRLK